MNDQQIDMWSTGLAYRASRRRLLKGVAGGVAAAAALSVAGHDGAGAAPRLRAQAASRALVLSGGGALGIAWEAGLMDGFAAGGIDFSEADLILGTSAGSVVGAHVALGLDLAEALNTVAAFGALLDAEGMEFQFQALFEAMAQAAEAESPEEGRRLVGQLALEATTVTEDQLLGVAPQLDGQSWPTGYACTAVDVATGEFQVWDAGSGVPLPRAVASSCAAPVSLPPVTINGRRYMDGGLRSISTPIWQRGMSGWWRSPVYPSACRRGSATQRFHSYPLPSRPSWIWCANEVGTWR